MDTQSIDLLSLIGGLKRVAGTNNGEYAGACPFCGGKDRFRCWPNPSDGTPRAWCRSCAWQGDAIAFVMHRDNRSFKEACEQLRLDLPSQSKPKGELIRISQPDASREHSAPALTNEAWQEKAASFTQWSWQNLTRGKYPDAMRYLRSRGIDELYIDLFALGWNPQPWQRSWGGIDIYIPSGLVIPWLISHDFQTRKINIRCSDPAAKQKYLQLKGGANWLYNSHAITPGCTVVMVEGEIDAISIAIGTAHHSIVPVATGSAQGARWMRWAGLLATAERVLLAFDNDQAGNDAAAWWARVLPNAKRLLPIGKDANDMLKNGIDIRGWIK